MAAKVRPCLVISVPTADEDRALVTLVPHTTTIRQTRFESEDSVHFLKQGVVDAQGLVTVPSAKLMRRLGTLRADQLSAVEKRLRAWLGFSED
jgi:mRNA interferase MazF